MNKLYYLLILFFFVSVTSCADDDPVVVHMQYDDLVAVAEAIQPSEGYVGDQFTITGSELGVSKVFTKVFIGDFEAKIITCTDRKIVAEVPDEAVSGKIFLEIIGKKIATELTFTVLED